MKKILVLSLFVGLVLSTIAFGDAVGTPGRFNQDQTVKKYVMVNTNATTTLVENISSDSAQILTTSHRILGFTIGPLGTTGGDAPLNSETVFSLYDQSDDAAQQTDVNLEAEIEARANETDTVYLPYPYKIQNGVLVRLGVRSVLTIYYEAYNR